MNDTIKIGLPMEYEDNKNIIRTGLWLKEYEVEALEKRLNKCNQVQSNWNSLREWLKNKIDNFQDDVSEPILHEQMTMRVIYEYMENLDKMNELEKSDSNN